MITYNLVRGVVKDAKKSSIIYQHLKSLGIDTFEALDNLPRHGLSVAGYSTHKLASQLREALILDSLATEEEE
jgi:hypothetical protein